MSFLLTLAWRNLWRNKTRTFITMASVFFAVLLSVFSISLQKGIWRYFIDNLVSFYTGYAQVHAKGYWEEQILDNCFVLTDSLNRDIVSQEQIVAIAPRIESFALVSSDSITKGGRLVGIDPINEDKVTNLRSKLSAGEFLQPDDEAVLLAAGFARKLQIGLNDTVVLLGQGYHGATAAGKYVVKGIVSLASPEMNDGSLYMPLKTAQVFYDAPDRVSSLVLMFDDNKYVREVVIKLREILGQEYEVMTWQEMMPEVVEMVKADEAGAVLMIVVIYMLVSFGIFSTLLMMTAERRFEFGMLMAVGMKRHQLAWVVLIESFLVAIIGCIVGILVSIPLVLYFREYPLTFTGAVADMYYNYGFEPILPTIFSWQIIVEQALFIAGIALLLSIYPILYVMRLNEVQAMKK